MSNNSKIIELIAELKQNISAIHGVLVATTDGIVIASNLSESDPDRISAMTATAVSLGKRISATIGLGEMQETSIRGANGHVFVYSAGSKSVLAIVATQEANLGLVHFEARKYAKQVGEIIKP